MEKWEYWVAQMELVGDASQQGNLLGFLTDRAEEGWELVTVTLKQFSADANVDQYTMFFKRPK